MILRMLCQTPLDFFLRGVLPGEDGGPQEPVGLSLIPSYVLRVFHLKCFGRIGSCQPWVGRPFLTVSFIFYICIVLLTGYYFLFAK